LRFDARGEKLHGFGRMVFAEQQAAGIGQIVKRLADHARHAAEQRDGGGNIVLVQANFGQAEEIGNGEIASLKLPGIEVFEDQAGAGGAAMEGEFACDAQEVLNGRRLRGVLAILNENFG
jgi:hypothetical protein